ncbi:MAG: hypothetical protein AUJ75_00725 [Candidatus Omnitrophica bacterium CG1_02_49_10]|nr:MAG: hypothetical protein AUJ75_00725 [Candidatus Omnitrophica bacterium CG1_02_49_10]
MKILKASIIAFAAVALLASPAFCKANDIFKVNSDVTVESGMTANDVVVIGGNVTVSGKVERGIFVVGGNVYLKEYSEVKGEIVTVGGEVVKDPSAVMRGGLTQIRIPSFMPTFETFFKGGWIAIWATLSVLALLGFLGITILLLALLPKHISNIITVLDESFFNMLAWGLVWILLIAPIAIMLAISIVGILLIPLEIMMFVIAMIIGYIAVAAFIGKNILKSSKRARNLFVEAIIGVLILFLISFLPVIGAIVKSLLVIAGFGAVIMTRFGTKTS